MQEEDIFCTKIKDGLYIGNHASIKDSQFLMTNRFNHILNCTNEIPNYFQSSPSFKYCKLKYDKTKFKLWGEGFKKLQKIFNFINQSQQEGNCCLIHSEIGDNRCCAVVTAYLMKRFCWTYNKTVQFLGSKQININLAEQYTLQLKQLEIFLQYEVTLTNDWRKIYSCDQQIILSNTYLNTIETVAEFNQTKRKSRHIIWKDQIMREKSTKRLINRQELHSPRNLKIKPQNEVNYFQKSNQIPKKTSTKKKRQILPKTINFNQQRSYLKRQPRINEELIQNIVKKVIKMQSMEKRISNKTVENQQDRKIHSPSRSIINITFNNYISENVNMSSKQNQKSTERRIRPTSTRRAIFQDQKVIQLENEPKKTMTRSYSEKQESKLRNKNLASIPTSLLNNLILKQIRKEENPY